MIPLRGGVNNRLWKQTVKRGLDVRSCCWVGTAPATQDEDAGELGYKRGTYRRQYVLHTWAAETLELTFTILTTIKFKKPQKTKNWPVATAALWREGCAGSPSFPWGPDTATPPGGSSVPWSPLEGFLLLPAASNFSLRLGQHPDNRAGGDFSQRPFVSPDGSTYNAVSPASRVIDRCARDPWSQSAGCRDAHVGNCPVQTADSRSWPCVPLILMSHSKVLT